MRRGAVTVRLADVDVNVGLLPLGKSPSATLRWHIVAPFDSDVGEGAEKEEIAHESEALDQETAVQDELLMRLIRGGQLSREGPLPSGKSLLLLLYPRKPTIVATLDGLDDGLDDVVGMVRLWLKWG